MADLAPLIRLRKHELDALQRALARARETVDALTAEREGLAAERDQQAAVMAQNWQAGQTWTGYTQRLKMRHEQLTVAIRMAQQGVAEAEAEVLEAFQALKTLELTQERRDAARKAALARQEAAMFDEVALIRHARGDDGSGPETDD